jgi:hypothetical protein
MRSVICLILLFASVTAALAQVKPAAIDDLVKRWHFLNGDCRGSSPPISDRACNERPKVAAQLARRGWCYGKKGEIGAQMVWHHCGKQWLTDVESLVNPLEHAGMMLSAGAWVYLDPNFPGQEKQACAAFQKFGLAKLSGNSVGDLIYIDSTRRLNFGGYADDEWQHLSVKLNPDGSYTFRDSWHDDGETGSRPGKKIKSYTVRQIGSETLEVTEGKYPVARYTLCTRS